mmetsp:Transcript_34314/g.39078  ORF Transcript_34314/g.39078 Transcript_34314/m.39078 type:complete len:209 (+) Transcript_34314:183-809(+)
MSKIDKTRYSGMGENSAMISNPGTEDVLLGRGPGRAKHNQMTIWRKLIFENCAKYIDPNCSRSLKNMISRQIVKQVQEGFGGRFLMRVKNRHWNEVPEKLALIKTKQALRDGARIDSSTWEKCSLEKKQSMKHIHINASEVLTSSEICRTKKKSGLSYSTCHLPSSEGSSSNTTKQERNNRMRSRQRSSERFFGDRFDTYHYNLFHGK